MFTRRLLARALPLALVIASAAQAQVSLQGLDRGMSGSRAQVLVLGTVHLSEFPESFNPAALDGLLDRLAAFRPEVITIEAVSGEECDLVARHPTRYSSDYCPSADLARRATGLDVPAALAAVSRTLKAWPAQPSPGQRRQLAALMLAANDRSSAFVQWSQLPDAERRAGDGLDEALVGQLRKLATSRNENILIAARLAARLGLARVHASDNHTGDDIQVADDAAFGRSVQAGWKSGQAEFEGFERQSQALKTADDLLPLYRFINGAAYLQAHANVNVRAALRAPSPEGYPQIWVAGWETRNLRMVANIREAFRDRPGARVLSLVGSGHKPWFDTWLGQMQGVDIVDALQVLK